MKALRHDPFSEIWSEFGRISEEMNRFMQHPRAVPNLPFTAWADEHNLYLEADLPAIDLEKLDVTITEGNRLTISGERPAPKLENAVWVRQERPHGRFTRSATLPMMVDADKVEARYEDGVLKLVLPKSEAAKPRKIAVSA